MAMSSNNSNPVLSPEAVGKLVVQPLQRQARAMQASQVVEMAETAPAYRIPVVADDPVAEWVAEGDAITATNQNLQEVVVTPSKVAGLTVVSRELANDSNPAALQTVGQGLVRDLSKKVDEAYFGNLTAPAPAGLGSLSGVTKHYTGGSWTNLDSFAAAINDAEAKGVELSAFVANPADALSLAQLKTDADSNQPLLSEDANSGINRTILGVPMLVSEHVAAGTVWGVPPEMSQVVIRQGAELVRSDDAYFDTDQVALRAILRIGFGFPYAAAIQQINNSAAA